MRSLIWWILYSIPLDAWELICIQKDHSKFVKYLAQAMWRDSQLANCYVAESNALVQIVGRSPRKKLQSPKKAIPISKIIQRYMHVFVQCACAIVKKLRQSQYF